MDFDPSLNGIPGTPENADKKASARKIAAA